MTMHVTIKNDGPEVYHADVRVFERRETNAPDAELEREHVVLKKDESTTKMVYKGRHVTIHEIDAPIAVKEE